MTGCASTYDQIVWGSEEAKATGKKLLEKPFFAELGACSPYVGYSLSYLVTLRSLFLDTGAKKTSIVTPRCWRP
jgi:hypothetical protein